MAPAIHLYGLPTTGNRPSRLQCPALPLSYSPALLFRVVSQFEFERRLFAKLMQAPIKGLNK